MNWLVYGNGWVWLLGLVTLGLALRFALRAEWSGAAIFALAGVLQILYRSEIRLLFERLTGAVLSGLNSI